MQCTFFLLGDQRPGILFLQKSYRRGVQNYFSKGVPSDESINFSKACHGNSVMWTMSKIPMYVKYIEREYEVEVFRQTKKRNRKTNHFKEMKCA